MAKGLFDILFFGGLSWLFGKSNEAKNKRLDRVEIEPHTWLGMSGKTRYNSRYLGPIQMKTFLSTSKLMTSKVKDYEKILNKLLTHEYEASSFEKTNDLNQMINLNSNIIKYMRQIDRRESLNCYAQWKNNHPESFLAYQKARLLAIDLDPKLEKVQRMLNNKIN